MKRLTCILLLLGMLFAAVSCGGTETPPAGTTGTAGTDIPSAGTTAPVTEPGTDAPDDGSLTLCYDDRTPSRRR